MLHEHGHGVMERQDGGLPLPEGRGPAVEGCRRGEDLASRGGLPLPEGRGPGVEGRTPAAGGERAWRRGADSHCRREEGLVCWWPEKDWSVRYESTERKNGVDYDSESGIK